MNTASVGTRYKGNSFVLGTAFIEVFRVIFCYLFFARLAKARTSLSLEIAARRDILASECTAKLIHCLTRIRRMFVFRGEQFVGSLDRLCYDAAFAYAASSAA